MNELDLDALAEWVVDPVGAALIAELRACRSERDELKRSRGLDPTEERLRRWWQKEKDRAERAEARIAAALEEHEPRSTYGPGPADSLHPDDKMCRRCKAVWPCATARALTGGDQ